MAQAGLFGTLRFSEDLHGWALDTGAMLAGYIYLCIIVGIVPGRSARINSSHAPAPSSSGDQPDRDAHYGGLDSEPISNDADGLRSHINMHLRAHGVTYQLPYKLFQHSNPDDAKELEASMTSVFQFIRVQCSPAHFGFAKLGSATKFFEFYHQLVKVLPHAVECQDAARILARASLQELSRTCANHFPNGVQLQALIPALEKAHGDVEALRGLLIAAQQPKIILLVISDAQNRDRLNLLEEARQLKARIQSGQYREAYNVQILENARASDFADALTDLKPTIVHFSGHGSHRGLKFADDLQGSINIQPQKLAKLLRRAALDNLKGVVMNASYTADQTQAMQQAGCAMVLMENVVSNAAAISFSASFYAQLARGRSFQDAFDWALDSYDLTGTLGDLNPIFVDKVEA